MIYDLRTERGYKGFVARCKQMLLKREVVELTRKEIRTKGQNNYLHLLLGVVAMETGNTLADVKEYYFKEICNSDLFHRQHFDKLGNCIDSVRSSADLPRRRCQWQLTDSNGGERRTESTCPTQVTNPCSRT